MFKKNSSIGGLRVQADDLAVEVEKLKQSQSDVMDSINRERTNIELLNNDLITINENISSAKKTLDSLLSSIDDTTVINEKLTEQKKELSKECDGLKKDKKDILVEEKKVQDEFDSFVSGLEQRKSDLLSVHKKELNASTQELDALAAEIVSTQAKLVNNNVVINDQEKIIAIMKSDLEDINIKIKRAYEDRDAMAVSFEADKKVYDGFLAQIEITKSELNDLKKIDSDLSSSIEEKNNALVGKQSELNNASKQLEEKKVQMLSLVGREQRINDLIPRLKEIAEKVGLKIEL